MAINIKLLNWYDSVKRDLPWRRTSDPYAIWVSEIMLQQTQVVTVISYYTRWMSRFPTPASLADSEEQEVLSYWQGLGYYRRCRMLLQGAQWVVEHGMPQTSVEWLKVPGVGPYTAGAIASIALQEPVPLVDGNVERVFARFTGCESEGALLHKEAWKWAEENLARQRPGDWNQALMELGATVCTPKNPQCGVCPIKEDCRAQATDRVHQLPIPKVRTATVKLNHCVWVAYHEGFFGLQQIPPGEWWEGMWEFPRIDSDTESQERLRQIVGEGGLSSLGSIRHSVTHHRIQITAFLVNCESRSEKLRWVSEGDILQVPMPSPQRKILQLAIERMRNYAAPLFIAAVGGCFFSFYSFAKLICANIQAYPC